MTKIKVLSEQQIYDNIGVSSFMSDFQKSIVGKTFNVTLYPNGDAPINGKFRLCLEYWEYEIIEELV